MQEGAVSPLICVAMCSWPSSVGFLIQGSLSEAQRSLSPCPPTTENLCPNQCRLPCLLTHLKTDSTHRWVTASPGLHTCKQTHETQKGYHAHSRTPNQLSCLVSAVCYVTTKVYSTHCHFHQGLGKCDLQVTGWRWKSQGRKKPHLQIKLYQAKGHLGQCPEPRKKMNFQYVRHIFYK